MTELSTSKLPWNRWYKTHLSRKQTSWSLRCIWSMLHFYSRPTTWLQLIGQRRETFKFWVLVRLTLEVWRYDIEYNHLQIYVHIQGVGIHLSHFENYANWMTWRCAEPLKGYFNQFPCSWGNPWRMWSNHHIINPTSNQLCCLLVRMYCLGNVIERWYATIRKSENICNLIIQY